MQLSDDIHNYYEHLVLEHLQDLGLDSGEPDYVADLCCMVLNRLPPRYIRHEVDMAFYLSQHERQQMVFDVKEAVAQSLKRMGSSG